MSAEYMPVFIESMIDGIENGAWMHKDALIAGQVIPRAYTSDLGILRLRVNDLHRATAILQKNGFKVRQKSGVVEVVPTASQDFKGIVTILKENGMAVEATAIIPGIYQG